jgi:two-component system response regulator CpxR
MDTIETPLLHAKSFLKADLLLIGGEAAAALDMAASILRRRGHDVAIDRSGLGGLSTVDEYDLVLLEADTRDPGAFALLDRLRKVSIVPVMVLIPVTARGQGIHALELGADCFVLLPFDRRELVARSEALIRRYRSAF